MIFEILTERMFASPADRGARLATINTGGELKGAIFDIEIAKQQRGYIDQAFRKPWEQMLLDNTVFEGVELGVSGSAAYARENQVINDVDLILTFSQRFENEPNQIGKTLEAIRSSIPTLTLSDEEIRFISDNLSSQNEDDGDLLYIDIPSSDPSLPLPHTLRCVRSDLLAKAVEPLTAMSTTCGKIFPLRKFSENTPRATMAVLVDGTVIHPKWTRELKKDHMIIRFPGNTWIKEDGEITTSIPRMVHFAFSLLPLSAMRATELNRVKEDTWSTIGYLAKNFGNVTDLKDIPDYIRNTIIGGHNFSDELIESATTKAKKSFK